MSSFILVIPPWNVLVDRFGLSDDMEKAIASEDEKLAYAWSDIEEKTQLTVTRELIVYSPKNVGEHYYYLKDGTERQVSLALSFVQFCADYREKPLYGLSKLIGSYHD